MFSKEENLNRLEALKEKSDRQFEIRRNISTNMDYKNGDFGIITSGHYPVVVTIKDEDIKSKDTMRINISRYDSDINVLYGMNYRNIDTKIVDFFLCHPNTLEYLIENRENFNMCIKYLKLYFIHNEKNHSDMILEITKVLDVMNPSMIKLDNFIFSKEAEKILRELT